MPVPERHNRSGTDESNYASVRLTNMNANKTAATYSRCTVHHARAAFSFGTYIPCSSHTSVCERRVIRGKGKEKCSK